MELKFNDKDFDRLKKLAEKMGIITNVAYHVHPYMGEVGNSGSSTVVAGINSEIWFVEMMEKIVELTERMNMDILYECIPNIETKIGTDNSN